MAYNGFSLLVSEGLDNKAMVKRHADKLRRRVWLRRVCYGLLLVGLAAVVALMGFQPHQTPSDRSLLSLPATMVPSYWQRELQNRTAMYIEDVIAMDTEVLLLVHRSPSFAFPCKQSLECRYGDATRFATRRASALHLYHNRAAILCPAPPQESVPWDVNSILVSVNQNREILPRITVHRRPLQWFHPGKVAYEAFSTETDVVLFVHGINHTRGSHLPAIREEARLRKFVCVYGGYFETRVTAQAQEVFRCAPPPWDLVHQFAGRKISVKVQGEVLPSVAYYNPGNSLPASNPATNPAANSETNPSESEGFVNRKLRAIPTSGKTARAPQHHVCSCTMIYNGAKFLKEWVYYNSHLGVSKFFLYDNNSDDELDEVISSLETKGFTIQKQPWPWMKTQEAGFSHCSVVAQNECKWMFFTDVDEFFFPSKRFRQEEESSLDEEEVQDEGDEGGEVPEGSISSPPGTIPPPPGTIALPTHTTDSSNSTILANFIATVTAGRLRVGQLSTFCYNFGPSGFRVSPAMGVIQGYTCRLRKTERHKSIVLLSSVANSLENVIHHFVLKRGYGRKLIRPGTAVINHYKFQAWDEFKTKFHRRAATYVADWTEDRNHGSKDRVPDLGTKPVKPADWESRYCDVQDYGLRNYTRRVFGIFDRDNGMHLPWE